MTKINPIHATVRNGPISTPKVATDALPLCVKVPSKRSRYDITLDINKAERRLAMILSIRPRNVKHQQRLAGEVHDLSVKLNRLNAELSRVPTEFAKVGTGKNRKHYYDV